VKNSHFLYKRINIKKRDVYLEDQMEINPVTNSSSKEKTKDRKLCTNKVRRLLKC